MAKLNFYTFYLRKLLTTQYISIGATNVPTSLSARNLGVMFDEHMNLESHGKNVWCSCFQHLKWISDIRKYHSWCSQTACPRVRDIHIGQWKFSTIWPGIIRDPQVADGSTCIIFKLLVLTYRSIRGIAPQYLPSLLCIHQPSQILRSASQALLTVDRTRLDTYGGRAFSVAGPALWNELPHAINCIETLS